MSDFSIVPLQSMQLYCLNWKQWCVFTKNVYLHSDYWNINMASFAIFALLLTWIFICKQIFEIMYVLQSQCKILKKKITKYVLSADSVKSLCCNNQFYQVKEVDNNMIYNPGSALHLPVLCSLWEFKILHCILWYYLFFVVWTISQQWSNSQIKC